MGDLRKERRTAPCSLSLGGSGLVEYRSESRARPQTRTMSEFGRYVRELLESQPRTPAGYQARLAAIEELVRQTDADARRHPAKK